MLRLVVVEADDDEESEFRPRVLLLHVLEEKELAKTRFALPAAKRAVTEDPQFLGTNPRIPEMALVETNKD